MRRIILSELVLVSFLSTTKMNAKNIISKHLIIQINNAGMAHYKSVSAISEEEYDEVFNTNI